MLAKVKFETVEFITHVLGLAPVTYPSWKGVETLVS